LILVIFDNYNLRYDAFNKICAEINEIIKKKMKEGPQFKFIV